MILLKSAFFHMEEINKSKLKEQIAVEEEIST